MVATSPGSALKSQKEQLRRAPQPGLAGHVLGISPKTPSPSNSSPPHKPQVVFNHSWILLLRILTLFGIRPRIRRFSDGFAVPQVNRRHLIEIIGRSRDGCRGVTRSIVKTFTGGND